jgi:hypothetical protein
VRSPRSEEKRTCEKDVKNRGNELNNSFGINKSVKKTNSKRTDFACKKEQLEAKNDQTARERGRPASQAWGADLVLKHTFEAIVLRKAPG